MSRTMKRVWRCAGAGAVLVAIASAGAAWAAQEGQAPANAGRLNQLNQRQINRGQPNQPPAKQARPTAPAGAPQRVTANRPIDGDGNTDRTIADWLAICNEEEIALGKLAASKAANKDVRAFADKLVKEHSDFLAQLQKFGARPMRLDATSNNRGAEAAPREGALRAAVRTAVGIQGAQEGFDFLNAMRQIAQQCVATAQQEWSEKKPEECDMAFVGQQLVAHHQMLQAQKVLRQYASPDLQAVIDKASESTAAHLNHAKELIHSLAASDRDSQKNRNN